MCDFILIGAIEQSLKENKSYHKELNECFEDILETVTTKETELGVMKNSKRKERKKSLKSCVNKLI